MKRARVIYIRSEWSNSKSYRAISLLGKVAEKVVAEHLSLVGEMEGWWHSGQCGSRSGRSTTGASAYLKGDVAKNRRMDATAPLSCLTLLQLFCQLQKAGAGDNVKSMVIQRWTQQWL
jgi:hypothetical protein